MTLDEMRDKRAKIANAIAFNYCMDASSLRLNRARLDQLDAMIARATAQTRAGIVRQYGAGTGQPPETYE